MKGIIPNIRESLIGFRGIVRNVTIIILRKKYFKILKIENIGYAIGQIFARTESIIKTHCVYVAKFYFLNSQWIPKNIKQHFEAIFIPIIQSVKETEIDIHSFSAKKPSIIDINYDIFDIIPEYKSINIGHLPNYLQNIYTESNAFNVVPVDPYLLHIDLIFESKKQFNYKNIYNININNISNVWILILTKSEVISNIDLIKSSVFIDFIDISQNIQVDLIKGSAYVDFIDMSQNIQVDTIALTEHVAIIAELQNIQVDLIKSSAYVDFIDMSQNIQVDTIALTEHAAIITGFEFKKQITITGSPNAGTNYQVQFNVGESAGSVGSDFHVNGNALNFPNEKNNSGDIQFTDFTGINILDFWVESVVGVAPNRVAKIWVEVREDLSVDRNIFIFYGNSAATNVSNGDNTFIFFDDFVGTAIDIAKWNIVDSTGFSVVTDELRGSNLTGRLLSHTLFSCGIILEIKARTVTLSFTGQTVGGFWVNTSNGFSLFQHDHDWIRNNETWSDITNVIPEGNIDFLQQFIVLPTTVNLKITRLDTNVITYNVVHTNSVINEPIMLGMRPDDIPLNHAYETFWDWIRVRKFVSPEPSFANISHEITTGRNIQFTINESSGYEHISPVILQLTLSEVHTLNTSVNYAITGGTATNGVDYHLTAGTATIPAGQLTTNIGNITIVNDAITEPSETIEVGLSNPVNAGMGLNKFHTYTIQLNIDWLAGFGFRIPITIPHTKVTTDEINYAIYIKLRNTNLNFANTRNDGFDIRFTASDGLTTLDFERDRHDKVGLKGDYMVRIPFVSATVDTSFFMYYGKTTVGDGANPTAVWDTNVISRHSLKENPTGVAPQMKDSTVNANHGTAHGGMTSTQSVEGKIGRALNLDGTNDLIQFPNIGQTPSTTWSIWFKHHYTSFPLNDNKGIVSKALTTGWQNSEIFIMLTSNGKVHVWIPASGINTSAYLFTTTGTYLTNTFHHVVVTKEHGAGGDTFTTTIDGVLLDITVSTHNGMQNIRPFEIGRISENSLATRFFNGIVDEVHISNIARSASWIALQFHSLNDTLLIYGPEETAPI